MAHQFLSRHPIIVRVEMTRHFSALRACLLLLALSLVSSGCGVKLAYNNADRLARWWVSDYIDLTRTQREYFDASTKDIMFWHRTTQLAVYRQGLLDLAGTIESAEMNARKLELTADKVEGWGVAFNARAVPIALSVLLALSPEQRGDFARELEKSNRDYEREAERDPEVRAVDEAKDYIDLVRRFVGRLSPTQRALVTDQHMRMAPDALAILQYRVEWQRKLLGALSATPPDRELLEDLMVNFDEHYTPDFKKMIETNEVVYQELTLLLLDSLTPQQRNRLVAELREYAEIFTELIAEAPVAAPPAPAPLSPSQVVPLG